MGTIFVSLPFIYFSGVSINLVENILLDEDETKQFPII